MLKCDKMFGSINCKIHMHLKKCASEHVTNCHQVTSWDSTHKKVSGKAVVALVSARCGEICQNLYSLYPVYSTGLLQ